jgi:hypothetical protein
MINIITSKVIYNHPIISGKVTIIKTFYYDITEISNLIDCINNLIKDGYNIINLTLTN